MVNRIIPGLFVAFFVGLIFCACVQRCQRGKLESTEEDIHQRSALSSDNDSNPTDDPVEASMDDAGDDGGDGGDGGGDGD